MSAQKLKVFFQKVRRVTNLVNFAFLSKDTLSALIQGDFESVAITFTLLASSRVFDKISNELLIKGEEQLALGDEKLFLREELDYDAKLALSLFTDEKIMLVGKRRFFGNALKAAAPFVSRGTSIFFAYNFVKGLGSNQTDSVDTISNGAIVAVDIGEASIGAAEYLGYIVGFSEVTGPIGEALVLLAIAGPQFYHVKKELNAIEKWVHLSDRERFIEGLRAFFTFQPSEYLEAKANNNQQVNKAMAFLKLHPEIKSYIFPTWLSAEALHDKSFVFLDSKRNLTLAVDTIPDEPTKGHFFCLSGGFSQAYASSVQWLWEYIEPSIDSLLGIAHKHVYLCKNAMGLEYSANRTGNVTLIALHGGDDVVFGSDSDTVVIVNNGNKSYFLGRDGKHSARQADRLFILQGSRITGVLQGGAGINVVKFSDYEPIAGDRVLLDKQSFICGTNAANITREEQCVDGLKLDNVTQIYGRDSKQDTISLIEGITYVDAYGGESDEKPDQLFITEKSSENLNIVLRPNTDVCFFGINATGNVVAYKIPPDQIGTAFVRLPFNSRIINQFYFESPLEKLDALSVKNNSISFQFSDFDGGFNLIIEDTEASISDTNVTTIEKYFAQNAVFIFSETSEIKLLTEKSLYANLHSNRSMDEIIQLYAPIAHRLDKALIVRTSQNETIAIGGREQEILSTDGLVVNHLIGNAGDSVYVIQPPKNSSDPFPLNDITIHKLEASLLDSTTDTLDLREVLIKAKELCSNQRISTDIRESKQDLILLINTHYYALDDRCVALVSKYQIASLILKDTLINNWYQDLDIILDTQSMTLIFDEDRWQLVSIPLVFAENKNIIVITEAEIKQNDELFILKELGQYNFTRNATDLFLTNVFNNVTEKELYLVMFNHFFQRPLLKEKILSLSLNFFDQCLVLREFEQEINNATDLNLLIQTYFNETADVFFNQSNIFLNNITEQSVQRRRREITATVPISNAASGVTPDFLGILTYIRLKVMLLASMTLNRLLGLEDVKIKIRDERYIRSKEKLTALVYCNPNNFFVTEDCVKNQSSLGLLGYCANSKQAVVWFNKNTDESSVTSELSWFAIADNSVPANNSTNTRSSLQKLRLTQTENDLYFHSRQGCSQVINLSNMNNATMTTLFPYVPEQGKRWLLEQWSQEKKRHDKELQHEIAIELFKQHTVQIGLMSIGNAALLHTFVGDYLQALGLKPNWHEREPYHFLARWLSTVYQLRLGKNQTMAMAAALLETALLHPKCQQRYFSVLPNTSVNYKKQMIRFFADLLQWGPFHFALIPSLLEVLFSKHMPIEIMTWGLRIVLSFYTFNNDPSYCYLGITLFFLPQLPLLLEHLGIPVTAYLVKTLEALTQLCISHSLIVGFAPTPDLSRLVERKLELQVAEQRVARASARLSRVIKPLVSFFNPANKSCFDKQEDKPQAHYSMH